MLHSTTNTLAIPGYEIHSRRSAHEIISNMTEIKKDIYDALNSYFIPGELIIEGGGGLSKIKQTLSEAFVNKQWKTNKPLKKDVVSEPKLAHSKRFSDHTIGLDILWNSKDTSFDTHLDYYNELFKKGDLHLCVMITRGASLQAELPKVYEHFLRSLAHFNVDELCKHIKLSKDMTAKFDKIIQASSLSKEEKITRIAKAISSSKFGSATTHMEKLLTRVGPGSNIHCPLLIIGIGKERLQQ